MLQALEREERGRTANPQPTGVSPPSLATFSALLASRCGFCAPAPVHARSAAVSIVPSPGPRLITLMPQAQAAPPSTPEAESLIDMKNIMAWAASESHVRVKNVRLEYFTRPWRPTAGAAPAAASAQWDAARQPPPPSSGSTQFPSVFPVFLTPACLRCLERF